MTPRDARSSWLLTPFPVITLIIVVSRNARERRSSLFRDVAAIPLCRKTRYDPPVPITRKIRHCCISLIPLLLSTTSNRMYHFGAPRYKTLEWKAVRCVAHIHGNVRGNMCGGTARICTYVFAQRYARAQKRLHTSTKCSSRVCTRSRFDNSDSSRVAEATACRPRARQSVLRRDSRRNPLFFTFTQVPTIFYFLYFTIFSGVRISSPK